MLTLGIDLAAEAKGTAIASVCWTLGCATVESLTLGVTDNEIVNSVLGSHAAGIDCPFGWPDAFHDFLSQHHYGGLPTPPDAGKDWRRGLAFRRTDVVVHEVTGRWPLSVSTDRIGLTAMRMAALLAQLREAGEHVDRAGSGKVAEVYPAAALRLWGLPAAGYKGKDNRVSLDALVTNVMTRAPWLRLGEYERVCRSSDDAFDAVVAALVSRAHATERATTPADVDRERAQREGWIVLPSGSLGELATE